MATNNASMELVLHSSDLLREILLRLPVKSLVKLQSVCKKWLSLISSPEFRQQHTVRGLKLQQQSLILHSRGSRRQWFHLNPISRRMTSLIPSLPDDVTHNELRPIILQSSNGLLLLRNWYWNSYYIVHNPATKQSRKIIPPRSITYPYVLDVALAFDPSKSPYYELVCILRSAFRAEAGTYRIEVYTSKSHTWKMILEQSTLPSIMGEMSSSYSLNGVERVYWNNTIFWSFERGSYYCCFDIAKREWKGLCFPPFGFFHDYSRLQVSYGHLYHVKLIESEGGGDSVAVWELELGSGNDDDQYHRLLRHHHKLTSTPTTSRWERLNSFTFLVDTCSLLVFQRDGWMRVHDLKFGSYEDFLDATGQPLFKKDSSVMVFEFGETLALV